MKSFLCFCLLFLAFSPCGWPQLQLQEGKPIVLMGEKRPIPDYFYMVENVYLARITAVHGHNLTFAVTETLRGNPKDILHLYLHDGTVTPAGKLRSYKKDSEWLLGQVGSKYISGLAKDVVGWVRIGVQGWLPTPIVHSGNEIYMQDVCEENGIGVLDKAADGTVGVVLDHLKRLLQEHPYKP